jgi:ammonia channel protein AmtB
MREHHVTVGRFLVFITFWSLLVYNPVARWSWHWAGWSNQYDVMDFAGGTAVHITSGTAVLAFYVFYELDTKGFKRCLEGSWRIFKRRLTKPFVLLGALRKQSSGPPLRIIQPGDEDDNESEAHELENRSSNSHVQAPKESNTTNGQDDPEAGQTVPPEEQPARLGLGPEADKPPHNVNNMILGTALLWIGWFGFNGGSALGGNLRAVSACVSTHVAACAGGTTSLFFFWIWNVLARWTAEDDDAHRVPSVSATHFCDGAVIGLVAITPAAGFVSPLLALDFPLYSHLLGAGMECWSIRGCVSSRGHLAEEVH